MLLIFVTVSYTHLDVYKRQVLAIQDETEMTITNIEIDSKSDKKNFTVDTLKILTKKNPDIKYYYIMGMDQANLFDRWTDAELISQMVQLVAFHRGGFEPYVHIIQQFHFILLKNEPIYASSSDVRKGHIAVSYTHLENSSYQNGNAAF